MSEPQTLFPSLVGIKFFWTFWEKTPARLSKLHSACPEKQVGAINTFGKNIFLNFQTLIERFLNAVEGILAGLSKRHSTCLAEATEVHFGKTMYFSVIFVLPVDNWDFLVEKTWQCYFSCSLLFQWIFRRKISFPEKF